MANKQLSDASPLGTTLGQSATDLISFHGGTVTSRRASAALTASLSIFIYTGASFAATNTLTQGLANVIDAVAEIRTILANYNLTKAGA